ncbi:MAG TPA: DUF2779 domain-containing protein [Herbaspirillum sp.]|uniref:DUF2779 domain-containing protein n=1 Tax=Herbaspirillum sp. TaxID=1890675 RepID=UPI002D26F88D|nr:DUF2779 domain-containing protein [Herbaspirillum sp.]HZG20863.1 DUF2779 domain-containing protein [Herbaspirillum sp.]
MLMLSKSKLMTYRQCAKRLWLEVHRPELRQESEATRASFTLGHQVGALAQRLYDPGRKGAVIDVGQEGYKGAFARTHELLQSSAPIFEAGFQAQGALAFADVMLPVGRGRTRGWRMIEVKSSGEVKPYHRDDAAVQAFLAKACGVPLAAIAVAHIDSKWVYPGDGEYTGLLVEHDLTDEAFARVDEVTGWIAGAQEVVARKTAPRIAVGKQCNQPYACGFQEHCQSRTTPASQPIAWLPGKLGKVLETTIAAQGLTELRDVPDELLNARQLRVKQVTVSGQTYFDRRGAARALASYSLPAYFIDFETTQFGVPVWAGTRPYQQVPFQFSVHRLGRTGKLEHHEFLDLSGDDPSYAFAQALLAACGERGPIYVYHAAFETGRISELAARFSQLAVQLQALNQRVVDLLPIAREHYYHPGQKGSWSIKSMLPALCPDLRYDDLDGVQDGGMAMTAYAEAVAPDTTAERKAILRTQLLAYCKLDTYAMVRLWAAFSGTTLEV